MRIGIFDSGYGGLTIYRAIRARLPNYDFVYLGDNARTPYGNRSFEAILKFTLEGVDYLFSQGCHLVIIACNTASAKALRTLQQKWLPHTFPDRRVLGIIRPSVESLAGRSQGSVALWATEGTVRSQSYELELAKLAPQLKLIQTACPLLVPLVEAGEIEGEGTDAFIRLYWKRTQAQGEQISALLLGCTHYPLLLPRIRALIPASVEVLVQDDLVAKSLVDYLSRHPEINAKLSHTAAQQFLTTDSNEGFDYLAQLFLGHPVQSTRIDLPARTLRLSDSI